MPSHPNAKPISAATAVLAPLNVTASDTFAGFKNKPAIERVLAIYNEALNAGSTAAVLPLYADDGVFMPPYGVSAIGPARIKAAYDAVFKELTFRVKFDVAEIVEMSSEWAFVRTNSAGSTRHASTGETVEEANQELFIFKKEGERDWRIARYCFSPAHPARN